MDRVAQGFMVVKKIIKCIALLVQTSRVAAKYPGNQGRLMKNFLKTFIS
jgi:hypothetical protein